MMDVIFEFVDELGHPGMLVILFCFAICMIMSMSHTHHLRRRGQSTRHSHMATVAFGGGMAVMFVLMLLGVIGQSQRGNDAFSEALRLRQQVFDQAVTTRILQAQSPSSAGGGFETRYITPITTIAEPPAP